MPFAQSSSRLKYSLIRFTKYDFDYILFATSPFIFANTVFNCRHPFLFVFFGCYIRCSCDIFYWLLSLYFFLLSIFFAFEFLFAHKTAMLPKKYSLQLTNYILFISMCLLITMSARMAFFVFSCLAFFTFTDKLMFSLITQLRSWNSIRKASFLQRTIIVT